MTYEMIKAMLVFFLDIGTIVCLFWAGKPKYFKIPTKENNYESYFNQY